MPTIRSRLSDIVSLTLLALLAIALATSSTTLVREVVRRPRPRVRGLVVEGVGNFARNPAEDPARARRLTLVVSGEIDLAGCWDWNTKAIYVGVLAAYAGGRAAGEGVIVDCIVRDGGVPTRAVRAFRGALEWIAPKGSAHLWQETEKEHDARGAAIDHARKTIRLKRAVKYYVEGADRAGLERLKVVVRYQVIGHFGWEPIREIPVEVPIHFLD